MIGCLSDPPVYTGAVTLIVARKIEDYIFVFSDTFSENPETRETYNWYSQPIRKVFKINEECWIAFSGNSHSFLALMRELKSAKLGSADDICDLAKGFEDLDLMVVDISRTTLYVIKDQKMQPVEVGYIGSKTGFEIFQLKKSIGKIVSGPAYGAHKVPDELGDQAYAELERYIMAFSEALSFTDSTFGGVPMCWAFGRGEAGLLRRYSVTRGAVSESELWPDGRARILPQDEYGGGTITSVWGSDLGCVIFFPFAELGLLHDGTIESGVDFQRFTRCDGFDINRIAMSHGFGKGIGNWDNYHNREIKIASTIAEERLEFARELLSDARDEIESHIVSLNEGLEAFGEPESIVTFEGLISMEIYSMICSYLRSKSKLHFHTGKTSEGQQANAQLQHLIETVGKAKVTLVG